MWLSIFLFDGLKDSDFQFSVRINSEEVELKYKEGLNVFQFQN